MYGVGNGKNLSNVLIKIVLMDGPEKTTIRYRMSAPGTMLGQHCNNIKGTWGPSFLTVYTANYDIPICNRIL